MSSISVGLGLPSGPNPSELRLALRLGRTFGLDSLLLTDHLQDFVSTRMWQSRGFSWMAKRQRSPHASTEPITVLGSLAGSSGRVRLGTGVTEPLRHHPVVLAHSFLTLAKLTRRSPILGIGAGEWLNTVPYGIDFASPVGRLEEAVEIIRLCFESHGPFDYQGRFFNLEGAILDLDPDHRPEIWIAAQGPRMLDIAGRFADGWLPGFGADPDLYGSALAKLHEAARRAGRDPAVITPSLMLGVVLAPTAKEAATAMRSKAVRYSALMVWSADTWRSAGFDHPLGPGYRGFVDIRPEAFNPADLEPMMDRVPEEVLRTGFLFGTVDDVVQSIHVLGEVGLRHVSIIPTSAQVSRRLYNYAWWAIPRIVRNLRRP